MIHAISYRLGLDLGASSLGWAAILLDGSTGEPVEILASGVRIFEAGVEGDIEQGKDSSKAVKRREARQPRRQQWRRQNRKRKLFELLQELELLPASEGSQSSNRKEVLDSLDAELTEKLIRNTDDSSPESLHERYQKLPYLLREKAVEEVVSPHELGRALYHLGQRRGYLSNRKGQRQDDDTGIVEGSIDSLNQKKGNATLGQYFSKKINPTEERIRRRYTARKMYQEEFDRIRSTQGNQQKLSEKDWNQIEQKIFHQRPLKSQKHLIGRCDLEPKGKKWKHRRCDISLPVAQEFRILQKVNDLRIYAPGRESEHLTQKEKEQLIEALTVKAEMTWPQVKRLLKLPPKITRIAQEEWDKNLIGHRTNAKMIAAFGEQWLEFSEEKQNGIVREVLHYRKPEALKKRAMKAWGLSEEQAETLSRTHLEEGHSSHSRQALKKLINGDDKTKGMKAGIAYATVRQHLYPESFATGKALATLPAVNNWKNDIRNPAVVRAMTEVRKVVNAVIRKYGKPQSIHIELARDLRNSRLKRKDMWKKNEENRKRREKAKENLVREGFKGNLSRNQVDKWLLAEECNFECPYCGKGINGRSLMGDAAEFNIEHIFPRRFLDNSYLNKTIACRNCNDDKGDRTPAQAFHGERYQQILQRVERFQGGVRDLKLARFKIEVPDDDFVARQMNDTRYNSKLAAEYLGLLYGGRNDKEGKQRIVTPTGAITGNIRAMWQLNDLLSETDEKTRDDHRHHAIDAIVVAMIGQKLVNELSKAAARAEEIHNRHFFNSIPWPWETFKNDVAYSLEAIRVSHRPTRTIAGPLHGGTYYSKNFGTEKNPEHRLRRHISELTPDQIRSDTYIVDRNVRNALLQKYLEFQVAPNKLWGVGAPIENFPLLKRKDGTGIGARIFKVRVREKSVKRLPTNQDVRYVSATENINYSAIIFEISNTKKNPPPWKHRVVDRLTACLIISERKKRGLPSSSITPEDIPLESIKFVVCKNDMVIADGPDGEELYRIQSISSDEIILCPHNVHTIRDYKDKRSGKQIKLRNQWTRVRTAENLRMRNVRRVEVDPIGLISESTTKH